MALPLTSVAGALHHVKFEEVAETSLAVKRQYVAGRAVYAACGETMPKRTEWVG